MIGCIRAGGQRPNLRTIKGLMLTSTNVYALVSRNTEGAITGIRVGKVREFGWLNRGSDGSDPDAVGYETFHGDLRIRLDGLMSASVLDRRRDDDQSDRPLSIYSRDYGSRTSTIAREMEAFRIDPLDPNTPAVVHVADDVTVWDYAVQAFAQRPEKGYACFIRHDDQTGVQVTWGYQRWPGMRPSQPGNGTGDLQSGSTSQQLRAYMAGEAYRCAVATDAGAWVVGVFDAAGYRFAMFSDGSENPVPVSFAPTIPDVPIDGFVDWTGIAAIRPMAVIDRETVRIQCTVQRWVYAVQEGEQYKPGARLYAPEEFVFDVTVLRGEVVQADMIASDRVTFGFSGTDRFRSRTATYGGLGYTYTSGAVFDDGFNSFQVPITAPSGTQFGTVFLPIDGAEKVAFVRFGGTWYLYASASGYQSVDQSLFNRWLTYSGQTAVLKELKVTKAFYDSFMGAQA